MKINFSNVSLKTPEWGGPTWFNLGIGGFAVGVLMPGRFYRSVPVWLYTAFRRHYEDPKHNCWGIGILQVGDRHLLGVISNEEKFQVDALFVHLLLHRKQHEALGVPPH